KYDSALNSRVGAAYAFVRNGTAWTQQGKLTANDAAASGQFFGYSVAVDGNTAVSGAFEFSTPAGTNAGAAYVYVRSGTTWSQQAKLTASDAVAQDWFGYAVGLAGDTALIGSQNDSTISSNDHSGSAYLFLRSGTTWTQQARIKG